MRIQSFLLMLLMMARLEAELIYPNSAVSTAGEFSANFGIGNLLNEGVTDPTSLLDATVPNSGNGYATSNPPVGGYPVRITLNFDQAQDLKAFYLWNNASSAAISSKGVKDFTLKFYDSSGGATGGGAQVGDDYTGSAIQGPTSGFYPAQQFLFSSSYEGVKSVDLILSNNHDGDTWVGIRELAFEANVEPKDSPIKRILVYLVGGQSNADGYGNTSELTAAEQAANPHILFYHGNGGGSSPLPALQWIGLQPGSGSKSGNAGGFGPELNFGRTMDEKLGAETCRVAVIKHTVGGTNLHTQWKAGGTATTAGDGSIYQGFQSTVSSGLASLAAAYPDALIQIEGMVWHQGEGDTGSNTYLEYETNLTHFIADLRLTYGAEMKFIIVQLSNSQYSAGNVAQQSRVDVVQQAQQDVADSSSYNGITYTSDLAVIPTNIIHFGTEANLVTGTRAAEVMMRLPITDVDGNELDDDWEITHFGSIGQSPTEDADSDGWSNQEEYAWQTSPVLATSKPTARIGLGGQTLEWAPVSGLRYFVEQSTDLSAWSRLDAFIPSSSGPMQTWPLPNAVESDRVFYRVGAQR